MCSNVGCKIVVIVSQKLKGAVFYVHVFFFFFSLYFFHGVIMIASYSLMPTSNTDYQFCGV